jgi:hypothetical protein
MSKEEPVAAGSEKAFTDVHTREAARRQDFEMSVNDTKCRQIGTFWRVLTGSAE